MDNKKTLNELTFSVFVTFPLSSGRGARGEVLI